MSIKIKASEITDELTVCPYCMEPYDSEGNYRGCCGEVHSESAIEVKGEDLYLVSEVEVIDDLLPTGTENKKFPKRSKKR